MLQLKVLLSKLQFEICPLSPKAWASKDVGSLYSPSSTLKIWGIRRSTRAKWLWDDFGSEIVVTPEWARICHAHCENRQITIRNINTSTGDSIFVILTDTSICQKLPSWWFWFPWCEKFSPRRLRHRLGRTMFQDGRVLPQWQWASYASDPHEKDVELLYIHT